EPRAGGADERPAAAGAGALRGSGPTRTPGHHDRDRDRDRHGHGAGRRSGTDEFGREQLGDLGGVERGALPQVVAGHEELQRPRIVQRAAHPPHPHRIGTHRVDRHRELPGARVVDHEHAGRLLQQVPGRLYLYLTVEDRVYRDRVAGDHGHAYAGGGDLEIRPAEDLARLVAQLHLLRGPTVVAQRPGPGD